LKTVAVTGSSGMLGRHIESRLESDSYDVKTFSRNRVKKNGGSQIYDLMNSANDELDRIFFDVDCVVHAAAAVPSKKNEFRDDEMLNANVVSVINIAKWCRKNNVPLVYISGAIVYENPYSKNIKESCLKGWSQHGGFYGLSKLLADDFLEREIKAGLKVSILRPSSIYGFGLKPGKLITTFLSELSNNRPILLKNPIDDCIDFIHAADVSSAVSLVLQNKQWDVFNLSSGCCTSIIDLAEECISVFGFGYIETSSEIVRDKANYLFNLDTTKAKTKLDWSPVVSLNKGIQSILDQKIINLNDS
jgi:UDP-glucose 4-epimerase